MGNLNNIGLDLQKAKNLGNELNDLLANYQIFYQNLRGFHWNIKGKDFFELHVKFEELYNDAVLKIDEIAERIVTLGVTPLHTYSDYVANSEIKESKNVVDGNQAVEIIRKNLGILLIKERNIMELAAEASDEGTLTLISDYISQQEKTVWMLSSYLGE